MPQLDLGMFYIELITSFIFFWILYILNGFIILPQISKTLKLRNFYNIEIQSMNNVILKDVVAIKAFWTIFLQGIHNFVIEVIELSHKLFSMYIYYAIHFFNLNFILDLKKFFMNKKNLFYELSISNFSYYL